MIPPPYFLYKTRPPLQRQKHIYLFTKKNFGTIKTGLLSKNKQSSASSVTTQQKLKCSPDTGNIIIMFWMGCFEYWRESWRQGTGVCGRDDKRLNKKSKWMGRANGNNWNERVTSRNYKCRWWKKERRQEHTCKQYMKQKHRGTVWTHGCFCRSDKRWECNVTSPDLVNLFQGITV